MCGRDDDPLLTRVSQTGVVSLLLMTAQSLMARLRKRARGARASHCSPHDLRRSFVDFAMVQALAGHASPATTARYDRRPEAAKVTAAQLVHVPFG
ncbi:MAG: site-specific integrase [Rhodospirillales bacterium]|nr:site-specific integrase [Rhodospirillales bacterium]